MSATVDPISDMLTRVRNAQKALHPEVSMPGSKLLIAIADVLKKEGYIADYAVKEDGPGTQKTICLNLKYWKERPVMEGLERVSKSSCRIYAKATEIPRIRNGLGIVILSTPQGVMTGKEAKQRNVGGEVLCNIW